MRVYANVKQIGKKKNTIDKREYEISDEISTTADLIREFVSIGVNEFNNREILAYLSNDEIEAHHDIGKISFQDKQNKAVQDLDKAIENALQCFEDGIYRVFLNDNELEALTSPIQLKEGDVLTFIRLAMLAGRMW